MNKKRKQSSQDCEVENKSIKKLKNLIKEYVWMISKVDRKLYGNSVETILNGEVIKTRTFLVSGEIKKELLKLKNRLKEDKRRLEQELRKLENRKRECVQESNAYISIKERRFNIKTSNTFNNNVIYRDILKEKNITTKYSVWPVGWPKKK